MVKKIKSKDEMIKIVNKLKEKGLIVVTTCGCYDVIHIGHIECLREAKRLGDMLIVGVNSDNYLREHKNRTPMFNEVDRCQLLSELNCIDYIFIFNEETFDDSLIKLRPNYFVKGVDRKKILEEDTAKQLNILIKIVGNKKRSSSSRIIDKINKFNEE